MIKKYFLIIKIIFMKITKYLFPFFILLLLVSKSYSDDFSDAMLKAKSNLKKATDTYDEKSLLKVRGEFERILQLKKDQWLVYYYISYVDYNLSFSGMKDMKKDIIKKYTESGLEMIDKSIDLSSEFCDSYVIKLALTFNRWMYEQDKMTEIIATSTQADEMAKKLDSDNPRYHMVNGTSLFYMPEMFGGGVDKALTEYEKSYQLFQTRKEKEEYYPDWGKDLICGYLAQAYIKRNDEGDMVKAKMYIEKGLEINPDCAFIKYNIQKQYDEKRNEK
jgi:hypothetical protein